MKASILMEKRKTYGINLTAETTADKAILQRFWDGGAKVNSITGDARELHLTFKDLIETDEKKWISWSALKDLMDHVDKLVAEPRLLGVILVCAWDLHQRLTTIEQWIEDEDKARKRFAEHVKKLRGPKPH